MAAWTEELPAPGLYYAETCDDFGNPEPGLCFWEEGKEQPKPYKPTKYFGPIVGALQTWPMVPDEPVMAKEKT